jgi:hypothetical protein
VVDGEIEWEVEAIRSHARTKEGNLLFLVKWVGWPESRKTWEPRDNFTNCRELFRSYVREHVSPDLWHLCAMRT